MVSMEEKIAESLYVKEYAAGHSKGCPMAIPELRTNIFTKCTCDKAIRDRGEGWVPPNTRKLEETSK